MVDGQNGVVVPAFTARAFEDALVALLERPHQAVAMGRTGAAMVRRRFSDRAMVQSYALLYKCLVACPWDATSAERHPHVPGSPSSSTQSGDLHGHDRDCVRACTHGRDSTVHVGEIRDAPQVLLDAVPPIVAVAAAAASGFERNCEHVEHAFTQLGVATLRGVAPDTVQVEVCVAVLPGDNRVAVSGCTQDTPPETRHGSEPGAAWCELAQPPPARATPLLGSATVAIRVPSVLLADARSARISARMTVRRDTPEDTSSRQGDGLGVDSSETLAQATTAVAVVSPASSVLSPPGLALREPSSTTVPPSSARCCSAAVCDTTPPEPLHTPSLVAFDARVTGTTAGAVMFVVSCAMAVPLFSERACIHHRSQPPWFASAGSRAGAAACGACHLVGWPDEDWELALLVADNLGVKVATHVVPPAHVDQQLPHLLSPGLGCWDTHSGRKQCADVVVAVEFVSKHDPGSRPGRDVPAERSCCNRPGAPIVVATEAWLQQNSQVLNRLCGCCEASHAARVQVVASARDPLSIAAGIVGAFERSFTVAS
mgnify:CR=1 FL=1